MVKKIGVIILMVLIGICMFCNISYADTKDKLITDTGKEIEELEKEKEESSINDLGNLGSYLGGTALLSESQFKIKVNKVITIISNVGVVLSVVALIAIGFKYMFGSLEERAEYKKTLIPYLIGAVLLFSMSTVPQILYKFAQNL